MSNAFGDAFARANVRLMVMAHQPQVAGGLTGLGATREDTQSPFADHLGQFSRRGLMPQMSGEPQVRTIEDQRFLNIRQVETAQSGQGAGAELGSEIQSGLRRLTRSKWFWPMAAAAGALGALALVAKVRRRSA